jgi:hypothetical protein
MTAETQSTVVIRTDEATALVIENGGAPLGRAVSIVLSSTGYSVVSSGSILLSVEAAGDEQMSILREKPTAKLFERRPDGSFRCFEKVSVVGVAAHAA